MPLPATKTTYYPNPGQTVPDDAVDYTWHQAEIEDCNKHHFEEAFKFAKEHNLPKPQGLTVHLFLIKHEGEVVVIQSADIENWKVVDTYMTWEEYLETGSPGRHEMFKDADGGDWGSSVYPDNKAEARKLVGL